MQGAIPQPIDPPPLSRGQAIGYAVAMPLVLAALVFVPAGSLRWRAGWVFVIVLVPAGIVGLAVLRRLNPVIFAARSRIQPGTERWDRAVLLLLLPLVFLIVPVAAYDATHATPLPVWVSALGYAAFLAGFAVTVWAQAVNPFFEPGVRVQRDRQQRVVTSGPYRFVRHPGYMAALALMAGLALALGSRLALIPAALAAIVLVVRTSWEDTLLRQELPGYADYAAHVRFRLVPGTW